MTNHGPHLTAAEKAQCIKDERELIAQWEEQLSKEELKAWLEARSEDYQAAIDESQREIMKAMSLLILEVRRSNPGGNI
jgi:hypothetical protein